MTINNNNNNDSNNNNNNNNNNKNSQACHFLDMFFSYLNLAVPYKFFLRSIAKREQHSFVSHKLFDF